MSPSAGEQKQQEMKNLRQRGNGSRMKHIQHHVTQQQIRKALKDPSHAAHLILTSDLPRLIVICHFPRRPYAVWPCHASFWELGHLRYVTVAGTGHDKRWIEGLVTFGGTSAPICEPTSQNKYCRTCDSWVAAGEKQLSGLCEYRHNVLLYRAWMKRRQSRGLASFCLPRIRSGDAVSRHQRKYRLRVRIRLQRSVV